jgi:pimeloyl-ACP methyl ester carboxylesterase
MHWIFLRGLAREQGHWANFPQSFKEYFPHAEIECLDSFGNGTQYFEKSFLSIEESVMELQKRSHFFQEKKEPLFLFSISMGSMLAVEWAKQFPDRFQGMILINTSDRGSSKFFQRLKPENYPGLFMSIFEKGVYAREKRILEMVTNLLPLKDPQQLEKLIKNYGQLAKKHPLSRSNFLRQILAAARYEFPATAPLENTLLLASKKDRLVSVQCSRQLADRWKLECFEHPSAGHDLPLDDASWIFQQIEKKFLKNPRT